jgi:hypothetical protein
MLRVVVEDREAMISRIHLVKMAERLLNQP